jgi:toxin YoeB
MRYQVVLEKLAKEHIAAHKHSGNIGLYRKIGELLEELAEHPREGIGKPEILKGNYAKYWSRRINQEHRLIYSIEDDVVTVTIVSAKGHYE